MSFGIILVECLFLLYHWTSRSDPDQVSHYPGYREAMLGIEGQHSGPVLPFLVTNVLIVVALWCAYRGARFSRKPVARALRASALCEAVLLATLSWNGYLITKTYPALEVREALVLGADGDYEKLTP